MTQGIALFRECVWDGHTYTNLVIGRGMNLVGLRFLARHLVTFDFPNKILYLNETNGEAVSPKTPSG